jgi:hypothetical protein
MIESQPKTLRIRVETLPAVYAALVRHLSEAGLGGEALHDVTIGHVSANCVLCEIQINGGDLNTMSLAHPAAELSDPRLARLKQGYCCRRGCDSYYYDLVFAPHPSVHWEKIVEKLSAAGTPVANEEEFERPDRSRKDAARRTLLLKIAASVGVVLLLLLVKHLMSGGSLPGLHREPKYRVDPASLPTPPGR